MHMHMRDCDACSNMLGLRHVYVQLQESLGGVKTSTKIAVSDLENVCSPITAGSRMEHYRMKHHGFHWRNMAH